MPKQRRNRKNLPEATQEKLAAQGVAASDPLAVFVAQIFDPRSTLNLVPGTGHKLTMVYAKAVGQQAKYSGITRFRDENFDLGDVVLHHIYTTHALMFFVDDESKNAGLINHRIEILVESLAIIFENQINNRNKPPTNFLEQLKKSLFLSTMLSYKADNAKKYLHDYFLMNGYIHKSSQNFESAFIRINSDIYHETLNSGCVEIANPKATLKKVTDFFDQLKAEYLRDTVPIRTATTWTITLAGGMAAGMAALNFFPITTFTSLFGLLIFPVGLGLGFGMATWLKNNIEERELKPKKLKEHSDNLPSAVERLGNKQEIIQTFANKKGILINDIELIFKILSPKEQAYIAILCRLESFKRASWDKFELKTEDDKEAQEPTIKIPTFVLSTVDLPVRPLRTDYGKAYDAYTRIKKTKTTKSVVAETETKLATPPTGSYRKTLAYLLTPTQQGRGFLACHGRNSSKIFFKYGALKSEIENATNAADEKTSKIKKGIWEDAFIAPKGQFGGIKYMESLDTYAIKLRDGIRIEFMRDYQSSSVSVEDNDNNKQQVPCYQATRCYKK